MEICPKCKSKNTILEESVNGIDYIACLDCDNKFSTYLFMEDEYEGESEEEE